MLITPLKSSVEKMLISSNFCNKNQKNSTLEMLKKVKYH